MLKRAGWSEGGGLGDVGKFDRVLLLYLQFRITN